MQIDSNIPVLNASHSLPTEACSQPAPDATSSATLSANLLI